MSIKLKKFNVTDVKTVKQFCDKYYRADKYKKRGEEDMKISLEFQKRDFEEKGFAMISRKDSVTGEIVTFFK